MCEVEERVASAEVNSGVCGYQTRIRADFDETSGEVALVIETQCPNCQKLAEALPVVDGYQVALTPPVRNIVYQAAAAAGLHASCPLPNAILKLVEVACGLALPRDVSIKLNR